MLSSDSAGDHSSMGSWAPSIVSGLATAILAVGLQAAGASDARSSDQIARLVRQLGSESFIQRQQATRELTALGIATREALLEASNDPDAEVRARARTVLATVSESDFRNRLAAFSADYDGSQKQTLPGWEQFAAAFGTNHAARQMFIEMQRAEPELFEAYSQNPKAASEALDARCRALLESLMRTHTSETMLSLGTTASLLLVASAEGVTVDEQLGMQFFPWLLNQPIFRKNAGNTSSAGLLKRLFGLWMIKDCIPVATGQNLVYAAFFGLKAEALTLSTKVLSSEGSQVNSRQYALLAIGRFGGPEHLALVEKTLADATTCGNIQAANPPRQVDLQMRDVGLSVAIRLTGQNARDYGPTVQRNPQSIFQVPAIVFTDAVQREKAFKHWDQWRAEHTTP